MKTAQAIFLDLPASRCWGFLQCHLHYCVLIYYHQFCVRCLIGKYMLSYLLTYLLTKKLVIYRYLKSWNKSQVPVILLTQNLVYIADRDTLTNISNHFLSPNLSTCFGWSRSRLQISTPALLKKASSCSATPGPFYGCFFLLVNYLFKQRMFCVLYCTLYNRFGLGSASRPRTLFSQRVASADSGIR